MQEIPWYTRACRLGREGRAVEALAELRAGLAEGAWYNPEGLGTEPDFAVVRPRLETIRRECEDRRRRCRAESRPQCLVLSPSSALWDQQTLFLLHGRGDSARRLTELWRPLVDEGWTLVVPQSSQPWDSVSWCWDDWDLARQEVRTHLEVCRMKRGLDPARIVVVGASDSTPLAVETAHEAGMPWLCVTPKFQAGYSPPLRTRGVLLLTENEPPAAWARSVPGVEVRTVPGIEQDFAAQASAALRLLELG